jgi:hypothetical protein
MLFQDKRALNTKFKRKYVIEVKFYNYAIMLERLATFLFLCGEHAAVFSTVFSASSLAKP